MAHGGSAGEENDVPDMRADGAGSTAWGVWIAAAAARSWTAEAHHLAAWEACRNGWSEMATAIAAGRDSAKIGCEGVERDGRMDGAALESGVEKLRAAVLAQKRARAEFAEAAKRAVLSADEWEKAASAHAMACDSENEKALRGQADTARGIGRMAAKWSKRAGKGAGMAKEALRKWEECAAVRPRGDVWVDDRASWVDEQSRIHADAEYTRAEWLGRAEKAAEAVRTATDHLRQYADLAEKIAASAGLPDAAPPDSERAVKAWRRAMRSARRAGAGNRQGV